MNNFVKEFDLKFNIVWKLLVKEFELLVISIGDIVDKLVLYGIFGIKDDGYKFLKLK